ncbi:MAG: CDP-diacylglycerol--serine O-phosphatidyltransferase [Crocinitomicaceae bacterium]|nr:CDP-diacylglycerol--serine O-phosphatidyltransferase [Crocinitomicaceae bacterium]|tara:strand:- start:13140 stop:14003 length:864 start_codon:yes stop_codon:yes gene_type:complete
MGPVITAFKNFIPNLLTLINLTFGLIGVVFAFSEKLHLAGVMVFIAAVFDFFDGFAARLLNAQSELGKELDSLADMVAFGVLPGVIVYQIMNGFLGIHYVPVLERPTELHVLSMCAFLLPACSAYRLAKFNIDTRQSSNFIGLPTPAMAIFFASIPIIAESQYEYNLYVALDQIQLNGIAQFYHYDGFDMGIIGLFQSTTFWIIAVLLFSYLMVSPLPIISMKFKSLKWADNKWRFIFLIVALLTSLVCFQNYTVGLRFIPWLEWLFLPLVIVELVIISIIKRLAER